MAELDQTAQPAATSAPEGAVDARAKEPPWKRKLSWIVVLVTGYLLFPLPLSVFLAVLPRPVAMPAERCLEIAYSPLAWLYAHSDRVKEFYDWYSSLLNV